MTLPPGFRFHPTDEELVAYYLKKKVKGSAIEFDVVADVDLYKCEPWDLPSKSRLPGADLEWFFFSPRDRKYPNGSRTNRATEAGYWKATGRDRFVKTGGRTIGMKKTLVFYRGRAPHGERTDWLMHEYRLDGEEWDANVSQDGYVLCRVFKKTALDPSGKSADEEVETVEDSSNLPLFELDVKPSLALPAPPTPPRSALGPLQDAVPVKLQQQPAPQSLQIPSAEEIAPLSDEFLNYDSKTDGNFWDSILQDFDNDAPAVSDFGPGSASGTALAQEPWQQQQQQQAEHVPRFDVATLGLDNLWNDKNYAGHSGLPSFGMSPPLGNPNGFDDELDFIPHLVSMPSPPTLLSPCISDDSDLIDPQNLICRPRPFSTTPRSAPVVRHNVNARVLCERRIVAPALAKDDRDGAAEAQKDPPGSDLGAHEPEDVNQSNKVSEAQAEAEGADAGKPVDERVDFSLTNAVSASAPTTIMPAQTEQPADGDAQVNPAAPLPSTEESSSPHKNPVPTLSLEEIASPAKSDEKDSNPEAAKSVGSPHDPSQAPNLIMTKPSAVDPENEARTTSVLLTGSLILPPALVPDPLSNAKLASTRAYPSGFDTIHVRAVTITCSCDHKSGDPPQMRATVASFGRVSPGCWEKMHEGRIHDVKEVEKKGESKKMIAWAFLVGAVSASLGMWVWMEMGNCPAKLSLPRCALGSADCK